MQVGVQRLTPLAIMPKFAHSGDACADICSIDSVEVYPNERKLVRTGLAFDIPDGYEIQVRSRSGNAINRGLIVGNSPGTIDSTYTGELKVILFNLGDDLLRIQPGDKIAQIKLERVIPIDYVYIKEIDKKSSRGSSGFGSTDIKEAINAE